jgi:chitodextrinase
MVEAAQAAGEPVVAFTPTDDSFINPDLPDMNFGSKSSLRVDGVPVEQSLLRFSVAGLDGRSVASATLWLYCKNGASFGGNVHRILDQDFLWTEDTVTWNNAPTAEPEPVASFGSVEPGSWYQLDLTSVVSGDGVVSLRLTSPSSNGADYASKESIAGYAPLLVMTLLEPLPDTTPPTTPTNLVATATDPTSVALTWNESIDDEGVAGYEVFRDGTLLASIPPAAGYTDATVSPATSYEYTVRAIDAVGNASGASNTAAVTTPGIAGPVTLVPVADSFVDSSQPDRNFGGHTQIRTDGLPDVHGFIRFEPQDFGATLSSATLRFFANSSNTLGVDVHSLLDDQWDEAGVTFATMPGLLDAVDSSGRIVSGTWIEWDVTSLASSGGPLSFGLTSQSFTATSFASRESLNPPQLVLSFQGSPTPPPEPPADTIAPSAPSNLTAVAASPERVDLSWTASTDAVGVTGYKIYRNGSLLTSTGPVTSYPDTSVAPNTTYEYTVRAHDQAGNLSQPSNAAAVTTPGLPPSPDPPPGGDGVTVAAAGDIACDPLSGSFNNGEGTSSSCRQAATAELLAGADAVLTLGDTQYENGAYDKFLASYNKSWGAAKGITYPAIGNHEYQTPGGLGYFTYFGSAAGTPGQGWYSFDLGGWHIISLNSNCSAVGGCGVGSPQYLWLLADLAANDAGCTLAYWHHPRFSSGNYGNDGAFQPFWQLLYNDGAEIVLAGHDHNYQRYAPQTPAGARDDARGIREFVVGTGGKSHYPVDMSGTNRQAANGDTFGVLNLTLRADSYDWQFVPEEGKAYTDSGTSSCH